MIKRKIYQDVVEQLDQFPAVAVLGHGIEVVGLQLLTRELTDQ